MILEKLKQDETLLFGKRSTPIANLSSSRRAGLGAPSRTGIFRKSRSPSGTPSVVEPMEGGAPRRNAQGLAELAPPFGSRRTAPGGASSATPDK
jgi:hypothetical protein